MIWGLIIYGASMLICAIFMGSARDGYETADGFCEGAPE